MANQLLGIWSRLYMKENPVHLSRIWALLNLHIYYGCGGRFTYTLLCLLQFAVHAFLKDRPTHTGYGRGSKFLHSYCSRIIEAKFQVHSCYGSRDINTKIWEMCDNIMIPFLISCHIIIIIENCDRV
jgi:hypothetical protein